MADSRIFTSRQFEADQKDDLKEMTTDKVIKSQCLNMSRNREAMIRCQFHVKKTPQTNFNPFEYLNNVNSVENMAEIIPISSKNNHLWVKSVV